MTTRTLSVVKQATEEGTQVLVERGGLRAALQAAMPHASTDPDSAKSRLRLQLVLEHVAEDDDGPARDRWALLVSACDGFTGGVTRVEVHEVGPAGRRGAWAEVDLPLDSVRDVLAVFKPPTGKDDRQAWASESMGLTVTPSETRWEEVGAFIDGKQLVVPRLAPMPEDSREYPDLPRTLVEYLTRSEASRLPAYVNPGLVARFTTSAKALGGGDVVLSHVHGPRGIVVVIGGRFVGLLQVVPERSEDDGRRREERLAGWSAAWTDRLEPLRRPVPEPEPEATVSPLKLTPVLRLSDLEAEVRDALTDDPDVDEDGAP